MQQSLSIPERQNLSEQYQAALAEHGAAFARLCADNTPANQREAEAAMAALEQAHKAYIAGGY